MLNLKMVKPKKRKEQKDMKTESIPNNDPQNEIVLKATKVMIGKKQDEEEEKKEVDPEKAEQAMKDILKDAKTWGL